MPIVERVGQVRFRAKLRRPAARALLAAAVVAVGGAGAAGPVPDALVPYRVVADGIPEPVASGAGDAARGRALVAARDPANCVLCHAVPDAAIPFAGDLGPSLAGVGARLAGPQLRLRVVDNLRVNPQTIMPSYYRTDALDRVAPAYRGKPILTAREVEDRRRLARDAAMTRDESRRQSIRRRLLQGGGALVARPAGCRRAPPSATSSTFLRSRRSSPGARRDGSACASICRGSPTTGRRCR